MTETSETFTRPDWDDYGMGLADAASRRGDCRRRQVGAVLMDRDHRILSTGYNGVRSGAAGCLAGACPRGLLSYEEVPINSGYDDPESPGYCTATHAEINALLHCSSRSARTGATIYVTSSCCPGCFKVLVNAGIDKIVDRDLTGKIRKRYARAAA